MLEKLNQILQQRKKAHQAEDSIDLELPALESLLPYGLIDEEAFFINKRLAGFGLYVSPLSGADETLLKSMSQLFFAS